jgi:hypothetical protein
MIKEPNFVRLDGPPTKPDVYVARGLQSQYIFFVDVVEQDGKLVVKIMGTEGDYEPLKRFHAWWSIPEPFIPIYPPRKLL